MVAVLERRSLRDFDFVLAITALAIVCFGSWMIFLAQPTETYWQKQLIGLGISFVAMLCIAFTDYRKLIDYAPYFYVIGLILLLLVLIPGIGMKINGQRCWLKVPIVGQFQPSEFVKIPVVLMLARYFGARRDKTLSFRETLIGVGILALPAALIMLEPDAGQIITYFPLLAVVVFLSSIKMRWVIVLPLLAVIAIPMAWTIGVRTGKIKDYQQQRINAIIHPDEVDPRGYAYHTIQSTITVGKGQLYGTAAETEFSQSALKFLPEPHSDFIFAVTAENTGFIGGLLLLLAYAFLISKLVNGARQSPDREGMLVIMAFAGAMSFQIFMNVGMALGLLPVIGVPLPLMSAGVSAVLATFVAIGFAISVKLRRFVN